METPEKTVFILPAGFWIQMDGTYPYRKGFDLRSALAKQRIECLADDGWELTHGDLRALPLLPRYATKGIQKEMMRFRLKPPCAGLMHWLDNMDHRMVGAMYTRVCLAALEQESSRRTGKRSDAAHKPATSPSAPGTRTGSGTGSASPLRGLIEAGE
ncbi:hypothetical protein JKG47_10090 [Acidithiobacillus sp. MC6.1]|nr:hypothetical protein [Acidithiobacillus sp. MC6.1]